MKEEEAIDALFARGLRNAEVPPPPAVWAGIERERDRVHLTLLGLRRRWGLLALLLLAGGAALYWGGAAAPGNGSVALAPPVQEGPARHATGAGPWGTAEVQQSEVRAVQPAVRNRPVRRPDGSTDAVARSTRTNGTPVREAETANSEGASTILLVGAIGPSKVNAGLIVESTDLKDEALPAVAQAHMEQVDEANLSEPGPEAVKSMDANLAHAGMPTGPGVEFLHVRRAIPGQAEAWPVPASSATTGYRGPKQRWWLAATVAAYAEERHWHGPEAWVMQAAEWPHHRTGAGLELGMKGRSGWSLSLGAEISLARADYRHLDRFTMRTDTVVPFVVTFNDQVLSNYTDTVTLWSEEERDVRAVNQWTALRLPLEASWHRGWCRWRFGVRGGMAVEVNSQRSGVALVAVPGGTQSVDVVAAPVRTTSVLLATTVGADIGFGLTDQFTLWATPGWSAGLFSLSREAERAYSLPERTGVGFRLSYALQPRK